MISEIQFSLNIYLFDKLYNTIKYNTIQYNKYNTIQYNTIQYNSIQYNTIQYNTLQYNTIQYNTTQYKEFTNWDPERSLLDLSKSVSQKYSYSYSLHEITRWHIMEIHWESSVMQIMEGHFRMQRMKFSVYGL